MLIQIKTLRDLYENDLVLETHCIACLRFVPVDLEQMIAEGKGDGSYIGKKPSCRKCGQKGEWQIRPKGTAVGTG
jgi:hypothetical protein